MNGVGMFCTKGIYGSGMVLQREAVNCVFGCAEAGAVVSMKFRDTEYCCSADDKGNWKIEYNPGNAGGPFVMELYSGNSQILFDDIYVGEVWVNSGQSNAQLPMERMKFSYADEFALPKNPCIRMITIPISYKFKGEKDYIENPLWQAASPETLGTFSGTAYFFAKKLHQDLNIPVGIINASQGGSPISAWMNEKSLADLGKSDYIERIHNCQKDEFIQKKLSDIRKKQEIWNNNINAADKGTGEHWENLSFENLDTTWEDCQIPNDFQICDEAAIVWFKKEINLTKEQVETFNSKTTRIWLGTIMDADKVWVNETFVGITYYTYPPRRYEIPAGTLKEGKNTITVRVQKNGANPIRFYKEKQYCIFTDDVKVHPVAYRNVERPKLSAATEGVKIDLSGDWKMKTACTTPCHPGEIFFEWEPTALFNGMLSPAFNHSVAGALWYQGESDSLIHDQYKDLLVKMIELWREKFVYSPKNMPFVVMQLPNWADGNFGHSDYSDWAEMRVAQNSAVESVENAAIAVCLDAGEWNDLHPEKKRTGGTRAAEQALRIAYGKDYKAAPVFEKMEISNNTAGTDLAITFKCQSQLKAWIVTENRGDFTKETETVYGFEFLTADKKLISADAKLISDKKVVVTLPENLSAGTDLIELRYLWANNPDVVNLYSTENLPAQGFKVQL